MTASVLPLKFQVGARTLAAIPRRLVRVALSLDDVLADAAPALPPLAADADGYLVTSLPARREAALRRAGLIGFVRQRYTRYYVDLAGAETAWAARLSSRSRSGLRRKAKKLAEANGGALDIRAYRSAADLATFLPLAYRVSATTYQERLLGSGLPDDAGFVAQMYAQSSRDAARGWLLFVGDTPIAYLWCAADGVTLRYDHVGHDPAWNHLSPGTVLMEHALRSLFGDRFERFDFTEGEGQHKRGFASDGTACVDLLLLRPTLANRSALAALSVFDRTTALGKRAMQVPVLRRLANKVRR